MSKSSKTPKDDEYDDFSEDDDEGVDDVLAEIQTLIPSAMDTVKRRAQPSDSMASFIPKEIHDWLLGGGKTPQSIRSLGSEVTAKMNWTLALVLIQQFSRVPHLMQFVAQAEETLYEDADFGTLETHEIKDRYKNAMSTLHEVLEFIRKFTIQNREALSSLNTNTSSEDEAVIMQLLRSAPVEKLKQVKQILQQQMGEVSKFSEDES